MAALRGFSGPVIGAINGLCVTGGLELALACDLLVAAQGARFADTHSRVGLLPGWGGSVRRAERIGMARALEMAVTARFLSDQEALDWGLINHLVPPEALLPTALDLARQSPPTPACAGADSPDTASASGSRTGPIRGCRPASRRSPPR